MRSPPESALSYLQAGAFFAGTGVLLGAFGAHGLSRLEVTASLDNGGVDTWQTAVLYQLVHGLGLLVIGVWLQASSPANPAPKSMLILFSVGVLCFSGSLYALVLGGPRWLGPITPVGGVAFIVGWCVFFYHLTQAARR